MGRDADRPLFEEVQRFAWWIRAVVLVPVLGLGAAAVGMWVSGVVGGAVVFTVAAVVLLLFAVPVWTLRLRTVVDRAGLHVMIEPATTRAPFLPPKEWHIAPGDISSCDARSYQALRDRKYWGNHFWGLGKGRGGDHFLYVMTGRPMRANGVECHLVSGEHVFVGSRRPDDLAGCLPS